MVPSYDLLETIQNISEPFFSKIKNERDIWGGHLKWDTLYKIILKNIYKENIR